MVQSSNQILGLSGAIERLREQVERLAHFDTPGSPHVPSVLVQGETGTGKGLLARIIHDSGPRAAAPFVDVNCAAIPETMLEAELFGFEAGAFTDAKRSKPGLFEAASGGTLFLDEIDSMPMPVQSKVLKAIEDKWVRRLGAVEPRAVDVKLIAATQRDLRQLAEAGRFRADLYHRLAVLVLQLPPLRERAGDIGLLAEHFLHSCAEAHGLVAKRLSADALIWLAAYPWPGNVRELGHLMERLTLLCRDEVVNGAAVEALADVRTIPLRAAALPSQPLPESDSDEAARIRAALARAGGNVVRAARLLGIGRNALRYRMRRLDIGRLDLMDDGRRETGDGSTERDVPSGAAGKRPSPVARRPSEAAPPGAAWEQKSVAVLALSLVYPGADTADREPWTEVWRWERAIVERVEGFGGVVTQRTPSRLTAAFGIPRALEQTVQRAVQAALVIRRVVEQTNGPRPEVRAAVHVGEVHFDATHNDPTAQLVPLGDAFALPERLLGHAGAGEVLLSPQAARRVERGFAVLARTVQLGPAAADRLTAHAVRHQQPPAAAATTSEGAPFVGRERELDNLTDAFDRAAAGHGHLVLLTGEAGIGKSRLLAELRRRLAARPHHWIEGRCTPYGAATPFLPLIDALRRDAGIEDRDDDTSAGAKIDRLSGLGGDLAWTVPFVKQLLSLHVGDEAVHALDSASRRSELFRALRALVLRAAEQQPLVVVVEDLHWADPASAEWLVFLADVIPTVRALIVVSQRTGFAHPFPDRSYHVHVTLAPLSGADTAAMTGSILGTTAVPDELRALITGKAEGNPFFVEELVRSLLEDGTLRSDDGRVVLARRLENLSVPDTVQDVLIARIDRLPEDSRRAIQVASVIGREFAMRLLSRITDAGEGVHTQVEELRSLELIYEKALHPELAYMFKHALTHDVAYDSVAVERRRALHGTIGRAIEELYADRLAEHVETLAHHFSRAEDWERALRYHDRSAEKAAATHANRAAAEHCRQALAIADRLGGSVDDAQRSRLNERLAQACFCLSEYAASGAAFEDAAARDADPEHRSIHLAQAGFSYFWAHRYDAARRCIDEALAVATAHHSPAGEAMALSVDGFYRGVHDADIDGYQHAVDRALDICARHPHEQAAGFAEFHRVMVDEWRGNYPSAIERAQRAIAVGRKLRLSDYIVLPTWFMAKARCCTGDYGGAIALLQEAYELCDRIGDRAWKSRMLNTLGWCFAEIGCSERAREYNEAAAVLARQIGDPEILTNADVNLALNHLALGERERALALIEPLEATLARPGDPWMRWRYELHVQDARARIELARGAPDAALAPLAAELAGARRHAIPKVEARALLRGGEALLALERRDEAEASLRAALTVAERIGYLHGALDAARLLAEHARRTGQPAAAQLHAQYARSAAERAAATLRDPELRGRLLAGV